jgi:hypothetical protein
MVVSSRVLLLSPATADRSQIGLNRSELEEWSNSVGGPLTAVVQSRVRNVGRLAGQQQFLEIEIVVTHRSMWFVPGSYFNVRASDPLRLPLEHRQWTTTCEHLIVHEQVNPSSNKETHEQ